MILKNLKTLRKKRYLTQQDMAKYLGISQNNYSYWENGKVKIDNISLEKLARFFNVSIDYLLERDEVEKPLTMKRLYEACKDAGLAPQQIEELTPEQLDLVANMVKQLVSKR